MRGLIIGTWLPFALLLVACGGGADDPEISGATLTTDEDMPVSHTVEASDPSGRSLVLEAQQPMHGTVAIDGRRLTYTPSANYYGPDSFGVTVSNGDAMASAQIEVTVKGVNDAPTAGDDSFAASEDVTLVQPVSALLVNDSDLDGNTLTVTSVIGATRGRVSKVGNDFMFTPEANFSGMGSFQYTVSDGTAIAMAAVTIAIGDVNDTPNAVTDTVTTQEDTAVDVPVATLLANDSDAEGQTLTVTGVENAMNGTVAFAGGVATFTPAADFTGAARFSYTVTDGAGTSTGTVTVMVTGVNDAPVAVDDSAATDEDMPIQLPAAALTANDTDIDGPSLTVMAVGNAVNGTVAVAGGVVTFTPPADFSGTGSFEYTVSDGTYTDTGAVTITVAVVNDAPVATDDTATTAEDTPLAVAAATLIGNDTDADGPSLSILQVDNPANGTVALAGGNVTFTPDANFSGTASFTYTLSDGSAIDTGTVTVTVTGANDAPVAADDSATTDEDTAIQLASATLTGNDTDVDGPSLTVTAAGSATNGTVAVAGGVVTFTPAANFSGTGSFEYTVSDGTATDSGTVTITVAAVNDAPVAVDDAGGSVELGESLVLTHAALLGNDTDADGPALTITAVQDESGGTAVLGATTITFTPAAVGPASFDYVVSDGTATGVGTVTITVQPGADCGDGVIDSPEACDDGNATAADGCSATCTVEPGWTCAGEPSTCTTTCGDGIVAGSEACDDADSDETDGCTTLCTVGVLCNATTVPGGDRFAVDPATGHCFAAFDGEATTFADAYAACGAAGGYLATIASAAEQGIAHSVQNTAQNPWIGAFDDGNTTDTIFTWVTGEPFGFTSYAAGQPDNDTGLGDNGNCLHLFNAAGEWNDTNCDINSFVVGRICELELEPCGDGVRQATEGEECDDGNATDGDGCSATCQVEQGCGDGNADAGEECDDGNVTGGDGCSATCQVEQGCGDGDVDAGEECDDDNNTSGDGCSATCKLEPLAVFSFTGAAGNEVSFAADSAAPGLASIPAMRRGSGLSPSAAAGAFSAAAFTSAGTRDLNDYFTFTVTPAAGVTMSLLGLSFEERRSLTGIRIFSVRSSLDSFATDLVHTLVPDDANARTHVIPLGPAFGSLTAPVELRIYGYAAEASTGTWRLDNVRLNGSATVL